MRGGVENKMQFINEKDSISCKAKQGKLCAFTKQKTAKLMFSGFCLL